MRSNGGPGALLWAIKGVVVFSLWSVGLGASAGENLYVEMSLEAKGEVADVGELRERIEKHLSRTLVDEMRVTPFHKRVQQDPALGSTPDFCTNCHGTLPHREDVRQRSYLNMHVRRISCFSCHFAPQRIGLEYVWSHESPRDAEGATNAEARIVPRYQGVSIVVDELHPFAKSILDRWKIASLEEKVKLHGRVHVVLRKASNPCIHCHTEERGMLDLAALGYSEEQVRAIAFDRIARLIGDDRNRDQAIRLRDFLE